MIGHDDEGVDFNVRVMVGQASPDVFNDFSQGVQFNDAFFYFSKQTRPVMRHQRYEIDPRL